MPIKGPLVASFKFKVLLSINYINSLYYSCLVSEAIKACEVLSFL